MKIIDFSSHDTWLKCPAMWYEKYVNKRRKHWPRAQRDDALALGSLVHEGLRVWQQDHQVQIPDSAVIEMTPTKECYDLALELVYGYARNFPEELWPLIVCEEPVLFPLARHEEGHQCDQCPRYGDYLDRCGCGGHFTVWREGLQLTGLAKIDAYFYNPEYTEIESGLGWKQTLQPGWWIHEYKTKSPAVDVGLYMQSWQMGLQASYQMIALQEKLNRDYDDPTDTGADATQYPVREVQGVLVNVIEKPKRHIPQRTCKACREKYDFATWLPTGTGMYACPVCGNRQELTPLKEAAPQVPPAYYRLCVTRTTEELTHAREEMIQVGKRMQAMEVGGLRSEPWNHATCVDFRWRKACDYFGPHLHDVSTLNDVDYEEIPDYRGLTQLEEGV